MGAGPGDTIPAKSNSWVVVLLHVPCESFNIILHCVINKKVDQCIRILCLSNMEFVKEYSFLNYSNRKLLEFSAKTQHLRQIISRED